MVLTRCLDSVNSGRFFINGLNSGRWGHRPGRRNKINSKAYGFDPMSLVQLIPVGFFINSLNSGRWGHRPGRGQNK